eukprot:2239-Heterococcus_DN1.PRE.3
MLDALLTRKQFRTELLVETFRNFVHQQQFNHWRNFRRDPLADAAAAKAAKTATESTNAAATAATTDVSSDDGVAESKHGADDMDL